MTYGLILAAGRGERFGAEKQFLLLLNKPVLYYPLSIFQKCKEIDSVILVVRREKFNYVKEMIERFNLNKVEKIVEGGEHRQDSVRRGLEEMREEGLVIIHDGVRPFIDIKTIERGLKALKTCKAVVYGVPISETVKLVRGDRVLKTIDRKGLFTIQTPQFFRLRLIKEAHKRAYEEGYYTTDDASLVEWIGEEVFLLQGDKRNIKITSKEDLKLAEAILS